MWIYRVIEPVDKFKFKIIIHKILKISLYS